MRQINAINVGWEMDRRFPVPPKVKHDPEQVPQAIQHRENALPYFLLADQGKQILTYDEVTPDIAAPIVAAMLRALHVKADDVGDLLGGFVASLPVPNPYRPAEVTSATLVMACLKLIASSKFVPKPVELLEACRETIVMRRVAWNYFDDLAERILEYDAVLLEFCPIEWPRPYVQQEYQTTLTRILELHEISTDDPESSFGRALSRAEGVLRQACRSQKPIATANNVS